MVVVASRAKEKRLSYSIITLCLFINLHKINYLYILAAEIFLQTTLLKSDQEIHPLLSFVPQSSFA